jgi:hypothetical protein
MATVRHSIDIKLSVRAVYNQLTQFEDYPRFMGEVETVQQVDDTHLRWTMRLSDQPVEWEAEITEQEPDRYIAWHNTSGPTNAGKVEVQPIDQGASRVIFTLQAGPQHVPGSLDRNSEEQMAQRLKTDLTRLKTFIEARGSETGAWRGELQDTQVAPSDRDAKEGEGQGARAAVEGSDQAAAMGTERGMGRASGESSAQQGASGLRPEERGTPGHSPVGTSSFVTESAAPRQAPSSSAAGSDSPKVNESTQSDYSLSKTTDGSDVDGRFTISEEVNLDQQSDAARRVGQISRDTGEERPGGESAADAMSKAMQQDKNESKNDKELKPAIDRNVPPSA